MPRKRKGVPQKVDEKKRKCLTWNMHEEYCHGNHSDSQHVAMPMEQHMVSLGETVDNIRQTESKNQSNVPIESSEYSISQSVYRDIYDASDYSLNIRSPAKDGVWSCILGKLLLKLSQTSDEKLNQNITPKLPDSDNFFLFVNKEKNSHYLVYSCHDNNNENIGSGVIHTCFNVEIDIPKLSYLDDLEYLHSLNSGKLLKIEKSTYNEENGELELNVCLYKAGVVELKYPSQPGSYSRRYYRYLQRIMEWFYGFPVFDISGSKGKSQDINVFFDYVWDYHEKETRLCDTYPQHPNLLPTLRPYQSKAVLWMLQKEHYGKEDTCEQDDVHPLWRMFQSKDNKKLYYNIYNAEIVKDKPLVVGEKPGGILADEMGLGKTVEVLACMLLHPRTDLKNEEKEDDDEFQNTEENVAEKVESNNPNFYSENTESMNQQQSRNENEGHRLRHAKRYMAIPTPLIAVEWWRICLDEAQMVESATTKAAEMALKLSAINRWCVTGTPIQKGIEDMYGLLLFLGVDPYWVRHWWHRLLYQPYVHGNFTPINEVVAKVLWRTAKKDVLDQINIPAQTQKTHWLKFSPVEDYFYQRKHQDCSKDVIRVMNKWPQDPDTKLNKLDRDVVHAMMLPLLKLRQACCHPQAVRGEFLPIRKTMMTMEELLQSLIQKIKIECEDAHRQLICALNGIAALHIIKDEHVEAVGKYRDVLRSIEEHKEQLKTDSIQRLHTVYNLHQILKQNHPNVGHTLRESKLEDEAEEIRTNYMAKTIALVSQSQEHLIPIQNKIAELKNQITGSHWWIDATEWCIFNSTDPELMDKIKDAFLPKPQDDSISFKFRTVRGLQFVLTSELEKLQASHDVVLDKLNLLRCDLTKEVLNSAIDCHLRPYKGKIKHEFSSFDKAFLAIFCAEIVGHLQDIFARKEIIIEKDGEDVQLTGHGSRTKGSWAPSELEKVLKILLGFVKQSLSSQVSLVQDGSVHMELFENMKKEFKCLRAVLVVLCDRVAAVDELEMATMRLRLRLPGEQYDPDTQPYIIEQTEFITCPICDRRLGDQWCVLCCGHCFCNDCMSILIKQYRINIKCAICREKTPLTGISYVTTSPDNHLDEEDKLISVKGSYSSKVEAIVRTLKRIEQQEQGAKSLVFSTWQVVLDVVAMALKDNDLEYRYIVNAGHRHFQSNLSDFKYDDTVNTLLLPVHCGSHGLNIVEATHVFLIEPLINPASEVQAIGRVHRIGQTKPTVVHHFLVKDTIEERIHTMLKPLHSRYICTNTYQIYGLTIVSVQLQLVM
uniref:E3 ubiquitin-protein ligase SHPRH-like n=1 Tax=Saccoglossus kowalevskii TaxID=10224 RepID=A0ABM0M4C9_SACKO|nr:PREDICTED: E3 ubiquitin-protein ligase SHPRH-like [Saccoglossus kowalevskii]